MKKKVLIGYNYILHYRKPFFNELAKHYDVTVLHSGEVSVNENDNFSEIIVPTRQMGPFFLQKKLIKECLSKEYDFVILLFDVRWVSTVLTLLFNKVLFKHKKILLWGAWITKSNIANHVRMALSKMVHANVYYTAEARRDFVIRGLNPDNLYVANNTFDVENKSKAYEHENKFRLLFVGSLDERKKNTDLIEAYKNTLEYIPQDITLTFVGDGKENDVLRALVNRLGIAERVDFVGRLENPHDLVQYYNEALVSISYGQAGLSVLQSLGFGVPIITHRDAISGGEKSNIKHNINGAFCDDRMALEKEIVRFSNDGHLARKMGENAYNYYSRFCTIENMVQGFVDAIENTNLSCVDES
ncbi:glycosyltransferase family 4 protein [Vibrio sp. St2]|uniref:glycosyltransferase family 4 protein n=1 Tax=Vibrio sp. St2 TaxID=2853441 RepID=UPI00248E1386|nr:glycosyltransferase family 4 protein [Vibrio sp. St2]